MKKILYNILNYRTNEKNIIQSISYTQQKDLTCSFFSAQSYHFDQVWKNYEACVRQACTSVGDYGWKPPWDWRW